MPQSITREQARSIADRGALGFLRYGRGNDGLDAERAEEGQQGSARPKVRASVMGRSVSERSSKRQGCLVAKGYRRPQKRASVER